MGSRPPLRQAALGAARRLGSPRLKRAARRLGGQYLVRYERRGLTPVLTVVMPVHDVVEYLPAALDSVLTQTLHDLEVIAVDDASTDGSLEVLRDYERRDPRVRVLTQPHSGQGPARNLGVREARGEFLTFVDADDVVPPRAFAHMLARLRRSGSDFCVGSVRRFKHDRYQRTIWARTVHARDRLGTTLEQFPNAMQDIIACNRMFRTAFWREQVGGFRGGIAYEDHVPMLTAYVRARQFDILREVTYDWRIRENRTSTSQFKGRLQNLLDRIEVKEEALALLDAEASDLVRDLWVGRTLDVDFPPFIAHALRADDEYRRTLAATYRRFLDLATDRALEYVTVRQKIRAELVAEGRWDEVARVNAWFDDIGMAPPATVVDGVPTAVAPASLPFLADLPPRVLRLSGLECHLEGVAQHVEWTPDSVRVDGWAYLRGLGITGRTADFRAWLVDDRGERLDAVSIEPTVLPEANIWSRQPFARYDGAGFAAVVDLAALPARRARWSLHVEVSYDGLTGSGPLLERVHESAATRPGGVHHPGVGLVRSTWDDADGLCLAVDPDPLRVSALAAGPRDAAVELAAPAGRAVGRVTLERPHAPALVARRRRGDTRDRFDLTGLATGTGEVRRLLAGPGVPQAPVLPPDVVAPAAPGTRWLRAADQGALLVRADLVLQVTGVDLGTGTIGVDLTDDAGELDEAAARRLVLAGDRVTLRQVGAARTDEGWRLEFSLRASELGGPARPAPSGRYRLRLDDATTVTLPTPTYAGRMPHRLYGDEVDAKVSHGPDGRLHLELQPPLPPEALGAPNRRRLRDAYRVAEVAPTDAVLFWCAGGTAATGAQRALDRALAACRPDLVRQWAVADLSVPVPDGAVPVLLDSPQWYDALAASRYLCGDTDLELFFAPKPHQRYLRTFAGQPARPLGLAHWRDRGFSEEEVQRELHRVAQQWDTVLAPHEEAAAVYRSQFGWDGPVLVTGDPATDRLVTADRAAVRADVLDRLGVPDDRTVVLWATPDDPGPVAGALPRNCVVLTLDRPRSGATTPQVSARGTLIDVTHHPDVSDLLLAADVAVLDDGPLRFDWALTGRPAVFLVPDGNRAAPLVPLDETAPGPVLRRTDEVAAALADPDRLRARHADRLAAYNARFNPLHDGHAAERVVEAFFGGGGAR